MTDLDLLRRYEPVVRYTKGEMFFPCAVDGYLARCRLWTADAERNMTLLAEEGELTPESIAAFRAVPRDHRLFLQFVDAPLTAVDYQRWTRRGDRERLPSPNRLQRVGLATRILDGVFDVSLLVRGRVPGGTSAAAQVQYAAIEAADPRRVYYGRVVRDGGYIVLHYLFFFPMNDWRSTFNGVNDHESDWEQVLIYLTDEGDAPPEPRWVAFASHDFSGDDLRRRWDDSEVIKIDDTHPVIYAGAGSHASYFTAGEYLMQVEPQAVAPLHAVGKVIDDLWTNTLRQATSLNLDEGIKALLSIPFVDYARGDGRSIGPGQPETWSPIVIDNSVGWVDGYRGLWGLDTWDPLGGERAPAGPKYNRDGSVRLSWRDPLAWAGLDKVLPPRAAIAAMGELLTQLDGEHAHLENEIAAQRDAVRSLDLQVETLRSTQFLSSLLPRREAELSDATAQLNALGDRLVDVQETRDAGATHLARLREGDFGPPRAHIRHAHAPQPPITGGSKLARWWWAVSGGLILLLLVGLVVMRPPNWPWWLAGVIVIFGGLDATSRGRLNVYLLRWAIVLALITSAILLYHYWAWALVLGLTVLVVIMIRDNLREVFGQ
jgi:hypothetical protein